jgi:hypothetical protein
MTLPAILNNKDYRVHKLNHTLKPTNSYIYAKPAASDQLDSNHNGHHVTERESILPSVAQLRYRNQ